MSETGDISESAAVNRVTAREMKRPAFSPAVAWNSSGNCETASGAISAAANSTAAVKSATGRDSAAERNRPKAASSPAIASISPVARALFAINESPGARSSTSRRGRSITSVLPVLVNETAAGSAPMLGRKTKVSVPKTPKAEATGSVPMPRRSGVSSIAWVLLLTTPSRAPYLKIPLRSAFRL